MNDSFEIIYNQLQLDSQETVSDEKLLEVISEKVAWYLQNDPDLLMSYLYRLDVAEHKINQALSFHAEEEPNIGIGKLILERQKQRWDSKKKYKVDPIEGWEF